MMIAMGKPRMSMLDRRAFLAGAAAIAAGGCADDDNFSLIADDDDTPLVIPPEGQARVAVRGGEIWYRVVGNGPGAPLLVVHGGPGLSHDYLLPLEALGRDRAVIFYDQLDCGKSDKPGAPANWRISRFVDEIRVLSASLGLNRYHLLGHSWGGLLAAELAAIDSQNLLSCVLASPLISAQQWMSDNLRWRKLLPSDVRQVLDENEAAGTVRSTAYQQAAMAFYRRHLCRMEPWPQPLMTSLEEGNSALYRTMWGETEFRATGSLHDYDGTPNLARITVPLLFTCGEFDEAPPATLHRYSKLAVGSEVRVFTDASHTAHLEQEEAYIHALATWLNGIG